MKPINPRSEPAGHDAVRDSALDFMRKIRESAESGANDLTERMSPRRPAPRQTGFSELPQYRQVLAHQVTGDLLGIDNPFYRTHEGAAGATTIIDGRTLINFASYDYLGLNGHPRVRQSAREAIDRHGVSASASRLVAGERQIHSQLENKIARFYGVESAVVFVSGYLTNVTTIAALMEQPDLVIHDELVHNSALTGVQLSGAARRSFRHNDLDDLERLLSTVSGRYRRVLVIVEGLYSMDGDIADLPALIRLRNRYGFWLMVDEAHALGVLGACGRGTFEHYGCDPRDVDIWMGTLSKTAASCGGYIAGSRELVTLLKGHAGGIVYSVGLAPALAAAASTSLDILAEESGRVDALNRNGKLFTELAVEAGLDIGQSAGFSVVPVIVGDSLRAVQLSNELQSAGVNVMPIIYPAVGEGQARLRFFLTSEHTREQIKTAVETTSHKLSELVERNFGIASLDLPEIARQFDSIGDLDEIVTAYTKLSDTSL